MKNMRKVMAGTLSALLVLSSTSGVVSALDDTKVLTQDSVIITTGAVEKMVCFKSFTGIVKEINASINTNGLISDEKTFVLVEGSDGSLTNFIVNTDTFWATDNPLEVGSHVTGFYDATKPVIMIYPPQYVAQVMVVDPAEGQNIKTDRFDQDLVSSDNALKLNLSDETQILLENGRPFTGALKNRNLVVYYDISTRSIPAQTTPSKVVVLFEETTPPIHHLTDEERQNWMDSVSAMSIVVNGKVITAPAPYAKADGTVMVPVRAVSEALGFEITWNNAEKSVTLNKGITFTLFKDYYVYLRTSPITLGTAPDSRDGNTYVPLTFFTQVARMDEAFVKDGQIIINGSV